MTDVVVVGGGVIGVHCAYDLARAGARVTLLERNALASGASYGNAGTISAGHPPLNRPGRVRQAVADMLDPRSPLYIPPRWDPALWRWLLDFARKCTPRHVAHAIEVMAPLGHRSLERFDRLVEEEAIACGYRREGYYDICATEDGLEAARAEAELARPHGYRPQELDPDEMLRREPALRREIAGGIFHPESASLDPFRFVSGLADAARRRGADLREGSPVLEIATSKGRVRGVRLADGSVVAADHVVVATGPFSMGLVGDVGLRLPVQPGKGYHRDVRVGPRGAPALRIACVLHESSVFCSPLGDRVRFAGTMEFSGVNRVMRPARLEQLTRAARAAFPGLGDGAVVSEWCGLRPVSTDGLPIVGPVPGLEGAWVATGHGMLGMTLSPATAELVTEAVVHGRRSPALLALSPDRFHPIRLARS